MDDLEYWTRLLAAWKYARRVAGDTFICVVAKNIQLDLQPLKDALNRDKLTKQGWGFTILCEPDESDGSWQRPECREGSDDDRRLFWLEEQVRKYA